MKMIGLLGMCMVIVLYGCSDTIKEEFNPENYTCNKWYFHYCYDNDCNFNGTWTGEYDNEECTNFCRVDDPKCNNTEGYIDDCLDLYLHPDELDWKYDMTIQCINFTKK